MTPRERVVRTLTFQPVDRAPRSPWALPGVLMYRRGEYDRMIARYPADVAGPGVSYAPARRASGTPNDIGTYVDAWGCAFDVLEPGVVGEIKRPLFADDYAGLDEYQAPWELLEGLSREQVALACAATDRFVLAGTETRPFERMQFLRGTEDLFADLALDEPETYRLRDKLHEFFLAEMRFWASTPVDGVSFMDDWGTQKSLLISPKKWRQFYKPLYREYCDILRAAGKFVFFHSDGFIEEIYPDLIEIGVNAVNSQLFCMDMEKLGRNYAGKIAFWGEIDRQHVLPFGTPDEVRAAVRRTYRALCPDGRVTGVFAQCEWGTKNPAENPAAVYDEWERIGAGRP
ncbi:MAG: methyltransferase [Clostridiales bacterium]|nr:methyltransferase [Clostridiales bacterium]